MQRQSRDLGQCIGLLPRQVSGRHSGESLEPLLLPRSPLGRPEPADVYAGLADPAIPNFEIEETLPTT